MRRGEQGQAQRTVLQATHPTSTQTGNQLAALCAMVPARASKLVPVLSRSPPLLDAGVVTLAAAADAAGDIRHSKVSEVRVMNTAVITGAAQAVMAAWLGPGRDRPLGRRPHLLFCTRAVAALCTAAGRATWTRLSLLQVRNAPSPAGAADERRCTQHPSMQAMPLQHAKGAATAASRLGRTDDGGRWPLAGTC